MHRLETTGTCLMFGKDPAYDVVDDELLPELSCEISRRFDHAALDDVLVLQTGVHLDALVAAGQDWPSITRALVIRLHQTGELVYLVELLDRERPNNPVFSRLVAEATIPDGPLAPPGGSPLPTGPWRPELRSLLIKRFTSPATLKMLLDDHWEYLTPNVKWDNELQLVANEFIGELKGHDKLDELWPILEKLRPVDSTRIRHIESLWREQTATPDPEERTPDAWNAVLIQKTDAFVDRRRVKAGCKELANDDAYRILVAPELKNSGRTMARYLSHVRKCSPDVEFVHTGIDGSISGPELANQLSLALAHEELEDDQRNIRGSEQDDAWAKPLAFRIVAKVKERARTGAGPSLHIVLLEAHNLLDHSARQLLEALLNEVATNGDTIRMALLGYGDDLGWLDSAAEVVTLDLEELSDPEALEDLVINFLLEVNAQAERLARRPLSHEEIAEKVSLVLGSTTLEPLDLATLENHLSRIAKEILVDN